MNVSALCASSRRSANDFGYDIKVPESGRYDVSVCFSELLDLKRQARVMGLQVSGAAMYEREDLDIVAEVGRKAPYILSCKNIAVDDKVSVMLKKKIGEPMVDGITVSKADRHGKVKPRFDPRLVTIVNCGNGHSNELEGPEYHSGMTTIDVTGNTTYFSVDPDRSSIISEDACFAAMGESMRTSTEDFEYVICPPPSNFRRHYDVAVVLCEIDETCFAVGKRMTSIEVIAKGSKKENNIGIFKTVGAYRTLVVHFHKFKLNAGRITIWVKKTAVGNPCISGFVLTPSAADYPIMEAHPSPIAFVNCGTTGLPDGLDGGAGSNAKFTPTPIAGDISTIAFGHPMLREICAR